MDFSSFRRSSPDVWRRTFSTRIRCPFTSICNVKEKDEDGETIECHTISSRETSWSWKRWKRISFRWSEFISSIFHPVLSSRRQNHRPDLRRETKGESRWDVLIYFSGCSSKTIFEMDVFLSLSIIVGQRSQGNEEQAWENLEKWRVICICQTSSKGRKCRWSICMTGRSSSIEADQFDLSKPCRYRCLSRTKNFIFNS